MLSQNLGIRFAARDRRGLERAPSYFLDAIGLRLMPRELLKRGRIDMHLGETHGDIGLFDQTICAILFVASIDRHADSSLTVIT